MDQKSYYWLLISPFQLLFILWSASHVWAYTDEDYLPHKDQVTCEYNNKGNPYGVWTKECREKAPHIYWDECIRERWYVWCTGVVKGKLVSATGCPKGYRTTRPQDQNPCERKAGTGIMTIVNYFRTRKDCDAALATYDCDKETWWKPGDGDGSVTHVVQTQFDCVKEEVPAPTGGAQVTMPPAAGPTAFPRSR